MADPKLRVENSLFGKYRIVRHVASGSSGDIFLAERDGKQFALKRLKAKDQASITRFRHESATLARLNQENLIKVFDSGEHEGAPFIIMEYLEGDSLNNVLQKQKVFESSQCVSIMRSVTLALAELHKNKLVHRDIKPANIFLCSNGEAKLIDLGLVGEIEEIKSETALVGTPDYCAPEQSKILKLNVDFRSDLYSVGVTLFEMLTGRLPFTGSVSEILHHHASVVAPLVRELNKDVRPALALIVQKLLAKDPDDRYQSATGLVHDLELLNELDQSLLQGVMPRLGGADRKTRTTRVKYVERIIEEQLLRNAWNEALRGVPGLVTVRGASGSGKTRLVDEFIRSAVKSEDLVIKTKCQAFDKEVPLAALREGVNYLLDEIASLPTEDAKNFNEAIIEAARGLEAQLLVFSKRLGKMLPKGGASSRNDLANREEQKQQFLNCISQFFLNLAKKWSSVLIFVDDLQWLDQTSLEVIKNLFESGGGMNLMILSTARNDEVSNAAVGRIHNSLEQYLKETIQVSPFDKNKMSILISDFLGAKNVQSQITDAIYNRAGGNPFIVIEFLQAVVDQGLLEFRDGDWHLDIQKLERLNLGQDVTNLIIARIDQSSSLAKKYLQFAASYGGTFNSVDIQRIAKIDESALANILSDCEMHGLIERFGAHRWKFTHDKIPEALLTNLDPTDAKAMLSEVAHFYYEKKEKTDEEIFITARLFRACEGRDSGVPSMVSNREAGFLAASNFSHDEAFAFLKFAYELCKQSNAPLEQRLEIADKLCVSATLTANWPIAIECSDLCLSSAKDQDSTAHQLIIRLWIMKTKGDVVPAQEYFKRAAAAVGINFPLYLHMKLIHLIFSLFSVFVAEMARVRFPKFRPRMPMSAKRREGEILDLYINGIYSFHYCGKPLDAALLSLKLFLLAYSSANRKTIAFGYSFAGYSFAVFGLNDIAFYFLDKSTQVASELDERFTLALCESNRLMALGFCGRTREFVSGFAEKREFFKHHLDIMEFYRLVNYVSGTALLHNGHNKESLTEAEEQFRLQEKNSIKCSEFSLLTGIQIWILNMMLLAPNDPQIKKKRQEYEALVYSFRKNPFLANQALNEKLLENRYLETLDAQTDELLAAHSRGRVVFDWARLQHSCILSILNLGLFEKSKRHADQMALRHQFMSYMQVLGTKLIYPNAKAIYCFAMGSYYRATKRFFLAEWFYRRSERLANLTDNIKVLFEIARDRARIAKVKGALNSAKMFLLSADQLALENGWTASRTRLFEEFADELGPMVSEQQDLAQGASAGTVTSSRHTVMGRTSGNTVMGRASGNTVMGRVSGNTVMGRKASGATVMVAPQMGFIEQQRYLDALLNISHAFVSVLDPKEQSKAVLKQIVELFAAERGFVFLKDDKTGELVFLAGRNSTGSDLEEAKGFSSTVVRRAVETVQPVLVAGSDEAEVMGSESGVLYNLRSIMATPLTIKDGSVLGAVYLDSTLSRGLFTSADSGLFTSLANHISLALELSRMAMVEVEKVNLKKELAVQSVIATESKKIAMLVDNMQQSLFSVTEQGKIVEPVSKFSLKVFGRDIAGQNVMEVLYAGLKDKQETITNIQTVLNTVFGEDDLQWDLLEDNLPRKVSFDERVLKVQSTPIWSEASLLEKILFVVEDVTELENLEKQVRKERQGAEALEDILSNKFDSISDFLKKAGKSLEDLEAISKSLDEQSMAELLRGLHTLKGNSRMFRLRNLSEQIHNSETVVIEQKKSSPDAKALAASVAGEVAKVAGAMAVYKVVLDKINSSVSGVAAGDNVSAIAISQLKGALKEVSARMERGDFDRLDRAVRHLHYRSVGNSIKAYDTMVMDIANQLKKSVQLDVQGDAYVDPEVLGSIQDCMVHLLRNSLDHGLESVADRLKAGKPEKGIITVKCDGEDDLIKISIEDDGRGIDADRILDIALKKGLVTQELAKTISYSEKLGLIFAPNFSSKDTANDISGRGIGMNVVKENIEKLGGKIEIATEVGHGTTFSIVLKAS